VVQSFRDDIPNLALVVSVTMDKAEYDIIMVYPKLGEILANIGSYL
jgi:hypothetical protein